MKSFSKKEQNLETSKILGLLILQEIRTSRVCLNDFLIRVFFFKLYIIVLVLPNIKMNTCGGFILIRGLSVGMNHGWTSQWLNGKESACQCRRCRIHGFNTWMGKMP